VEETWELAALGFDDMNLELLISLLSSTIILVLCILIPLVLGIFIIVKLWDLIDDPLNVVIGKTVQSGEEQSELRKEYSRATEPYYLESIDDHPDPYRDGRNYYRQLSDEEAKAKKVEVEQAKKLFNEKYPDFFSELKLLKKTQVNPRRLLAFLSWVIGGVLVFSSPVLFYAATGYFGVNISVQSYKQAGLEKQSRDEITQELIGELGSIASELSEPRSLTLEQIERITEKLPPAVSELQSNLEKADAQMRAARQSLELEQEDLAIQKEKFDKVSALSTEEFEAVKTVLFEETEKSTRRYYLIGLFSSIPVFWFSELLKALFLKWLDRLKLLNWRRSANKRNESNQKQIHDQN
jgi:hypothetical protein